MRCAARYSLFRGPARVGASLVTGLALFVLPARAVDCTPRTAQSTCFDADTLWVPASPTAFVGIPGASALPARSFALTADASYLSRPVVLSTLSPDPNGRDVRVVDDVVDATISGAYAPVRHLELTIALPMAVYRTGTGLSGVTTQSGPGLEGTALRDIRIGAAHDIVTLRPQGFRIDIATALVLSLPTGDASEFAGAREPVTSPGLSFSLRKGVFFAGADAGARIRRPVSIGGARLGTEIVSMLGAGIDALDRERLALAVEAWLYPTFLSQEQTFRDGVRVTEGTLVPAEWMLSARTRLGDVTLVGGFGTAIRLSSETRRSPTGETASDSFAGVTAPRVRATLVARWVH
jgi:hypothetical protein